MKVISSSFSTFHMVEQAQQLERLGILEKFITGIPKFASSKHKLPKSRVISLWKSFALSYINNKFRILSNQDFYDKLVKASHNNFSKNLPNKLNKNIDFFIGLSSFCYEGLLRANDLGICSIVDHGSLHQKFEQNELFIESQKFGFSIGGINKYQWLIDKQEKEYKIAKKVLVLSSLAKKTFIEQGIDENKILVNNLGVSIKTFRDIKKEDKKFRVLYCGNVAPAKGIHYLLKSFSLLNLPNAELWVIGDTNYLKEDSLFEKHIKKYITNKVIFKGKISSNQIYKFFSQCSILVLPSLSDGFGKVVSEAMSCKLPVIVSQNTGAKDLVIDDYNGYIIPVRNESSISEKLEYLYYEKEKLIYMANNAQEYVRNNATWKNYGERLFDLLNQNLVKK